MRLALTFLHGRIGRRTRLVALVAALVTAAAGVALAAAAERDVPGALAEPVGIVPAAAHRETPTAPGAPARSPSTTGAPIGAAPSPAPTPAPDPAPTAAAATGPGPSANELARVPTTSAPATPEAPVAAARRAGPAPATPAPTVPGPPAAEPAAADAAAPAPAADAVHCVVRLHGKGGTGAAPRARDGFVELAPGGNAPGWGGRQWLYFPESGYQAALASVRGAVDGAGCTRVVVDGFSNGAAFAAKLYCRGESLGGRLAGVIVDDPVTDHAVEACAPASGVRVTLYWTGALQGVAQPGWSCANADWTCEGGTTIGIDAYAAALGTAAKRSPNTAHAAYTDPPELTSF